MNLAPYRKSIAALVGAILTWLTATLTDNAVTTSEWIALGVAVATALGVYGTPNEVEVGKKPFKAERGDAAGALIWIVVVVALACLLGLTVHHWFFLLLLLLLVVFLVV